MRKINDPVFGLIEINEMESRIIDSPLFQRLKYIKQLALAHYVYPGATHTRFSHSLGVFKIAGEICNTLQEYDSDLFCNTNIENLKMAALLHDIGHFPFSHALEFEKKKERFDIKDLPFYFKISHEKFGAYIIQKSYLRSLLEENGYDYELICNLIEGKDIENLIFNKIINWELDADRLDYIIRDSYYTGVGFGKINYQYLISNFKSFENKRIVIDSKAIRDIEHFIISRVALYDRVYTHKTNSYFNFILALTAYDLILNFDYPSFRNEQELNEIIKNEENSKSLIELSDFSYMDKMRDCLSKEGTDENTNNHINYLLFRIKNFKIFRFSSFSLKSDYEIDLKKFKISNLLKALLSEYPDEIYIDIPKSKFTGYIPVSIPPSGLDEETLIRMREEEEHTIWIQHNSNPPEIFYRSKKTFFEKIHNLGITKLLVYVNKDNDELISKFERLREDINRIMQS